MKTLISTKYRIEHGDYAIYAKLWAESGKITLKTENQDYNFVFKKSKPEDLKELGKLLIEAGGLK